MPTGVVARFDPRRGYGFVIPDDGGEDVFVHQNNIDMEGFRYLKPGEQVNYELEVGEKGLKAVQVQLLSERQPGDSPFGEQDRQERTGERYAPRERTPRQGGRERYAERRPPRGGGDDRLQGEVEKLRRKQERLISLLVAKGVLAPGEIDGLDGTHAVEYDAADEADE